MKRLPLKLLALPVALLLASSCASKLKRDLTDNTPGGMQLEASLDTSLIHFKVAATGEVVNLREYMVAEDRDFLMLTFGSKGCAACNRKAEHLTKEVIGLHPLFLTEPGRHFEIIGINTDNEPYARLAGYLSSFPFIKWSDPSGKMMLEFFMPPGNKFSVPLTVMINKEGIAWRVLPHDTISLTAILAKVEHTLGIRDDLPDSDGQGSDEGGEGEGDDGIPGDGEGDGGEAGGDPGPEIPVIGLSLVGPGRLKGVETKSCGAQALTLDSALGAGDVRFVQVVSGNCGGTCQANLAELKKTATACDAGSTGRSCAVASLQTGTLLAGECASDIAWQGGAEFFEVFKTYFDWSYKPVEGPAPEYKLSVPAVEGPLLFGFNGKGEIVFSKEGALSEGELLAAMAQPDFGKLTRGPDFPLYDKTRGNFRFADFRSKSRFTVVSAWGAYPAACGSCIAELQHWSKEGELIDFCNSRPGDCQFVAMEAHLPETEMPDKTIEQFYDGIMTGDGMGFDGLAALGIRAPLILDPTSSLGSDTAYLNRFFDGYMVAAVPEYGTNYRTFLYDREGKIMATFKSMMPSGVDPVKAKLEELLKN